MGDTCPRCRINVLKEPTELNAISEISTTERTIWVCSTCGRMENYIKFFRSKNQLNKIPQKELDIEREFRERYL